MRSIEAIDRYQLVSRLGKGGMAEVFRAKLTGIGGFERTVALKVLLPSFAAEPEFVEMLLDEARIAGAIDHPNVLQVLDVGRKGDLFYLVMEYVDGQDLRTIAKQVPGGRLPLGMSLYVMSEMLRGLEAVHDARDERGYPRNIVHRDISPGNVMVDRRGFVKLGDFGIAHASGRITRTRVGAIKGKSRYMAPEQLAGNPVDHRADLYAVGVTLFEAILGDFARESSKPTIYGPMFTWPERLPKGAMPGDVEAILRRAITESPEHRYRDCGELRVDLEIALHRAAPGYNPDVLARELRRLLGESSFPAALDAATTVPDQAQAVSVRPVRWRGVPTAEHSIHPSSGITGDRTPVQARGEQLVSSPTIPTLASRARPPSGAFRIEPERVEQARSLTTDADLARISGKFQPVLGARPPINRRLGIGLVVALLALVTVGIAAAVATSGSAAPTAVEESRPAQPAPVTRPEPRTSPLPTSGAVEVRGPAGAQVRIGGTVYPPAPTRIELPPGDYLVQLRSGRRHHATTHQVHVIAGRTLTLQ
jgi:serine/threonine-protein kinase